MPEVLREHMDSYFKQEEERPYSHHQLKLSGIYRQIRE